MLDIPVNVNVVALTPQLTANPSFLNTGMVVGTQTSLSFQVTNIGGAPSGDLQVLLPTASFLSLASSPVIPSLAPGASSTVTLELDPASSTPLGPYSGTIVLNSEDASLTMPFTFRAITTAVGDVQVLVDDDYTFTVAGSPHVSGATVSLLDPFDNSQVIATGTTDSTGQVTLTNVPAGPYVLQVQAASHASYQASYTVVPGITNTDEVFISNQLVTYSWQVTPASVADQYTVQLQTTFQTDVPAPVVTISAPAELPTLQPGQTGQFNLTLTNHGLIAAQDASVTLPTDPEYTFSGLSTDVGNPPANTSVTVIVGNIPANTSVTVPVMVVRNASDPPPGSSGSGTGGSASGTVASGSSAGSASAPSDPPPCTLDIPALYYFSCAGIRHELIAGTTIHVNGRVCNAVAAIMAGLDNILAIPVPVPPTITLNPTPGPSPILPGLPSNGPSLLVPSLPPVITPTNCDPCLDELASDLNDYLFQNNLILKPVVNAINKVEGALSNLAAAANAIDDLVSFLQTTPRFDPAQLNMAALGLQGASLTINVDQIEAVYGGVQKAENVLGILKTVIQTAEVCFAARTGQPSQSMSLTSMSGGNPALENALAEVEQDEGRLETVVQAYIAYFGSPDWLATSQSTDSGAVAR